MFSPLRGSPKTNAQIKVRRRSLAPSGKIPRRFELRRPIQAEAANVGSQ
jgi:hypothetical protein